MKLSLIQPTITGREESNERMLQFYRDRTPVELEVISVKDYPNWPAGCNAGMKQATGDVFFYGSDDVEPLEGWYEAMMRTLSNGEVPGSYYWDHPAGSGEPCNYTPSGDPVNLRADGAPGAVPPFSRGPALTREWAELVGPWPEIDYYADNWVSDKVRTLGIEVRMTEGFNFVHHWHPVGRLDAGDWVARNVPLYNAERAKLGLGPVGR